MSTNLLGEFWGIFVFLLGGGVRGVPFFARVG